MRPGTKRLKHDSYLAPTKQPGKSFRIGLGESTRMGPDGYTGNAYRLAWRTELADMLLKEVNDSKTTTYRISNEQRSPLAAFVWMSGTQVA